MPIPSSSDAHRPAGHPPVQHGRIGVLLLNLGTPDATDYWSMRRYLKEFLSDRRVIEVPRWKWWPILNGIILTVRPGRKGKDYAKIWNNERNEGPLKTITRSQAEKLARAARRRAHRRRLGHALRQPDHRRAPRLAAGTGLRPHPAGAALSAVRRRHHGDGLRPGLPRADARCAGSRPCAWRRPTSRTPPTSRRSPPRSATTSPRSTSSPRRSSPRSTACRRRTWKPATPTTATARRPRGWCARRSGWPSERWHTTFQSQFGSDPWLQPYTIDTVERLAKSGVKRLADRRARLLRRLPRDAGGARHGEPRTPSSPTAASSFAYVPCLNDSDAGVRRHREPSCAAS